MPSKQLLKMSSLNNMDFLIDCLRAEDLPHGDLAEPDREFWQFEQDGQLVAFAGVEGISNERLLRSFLVLPAYRQTGVGSEALELLEILLAQRGIDGLHLLTTTARPFFQRHGFECSERVNAPLAIQHSLEFRSLCPATATYLVKRLAQIDR